MLCETASYLVHPAVSVAVQMLPRTVLEVLEKISGVV
jgi:hypothetical protein